MPIVNRLGGIFDKDGKAKQAGGIFDKDGLAPTLTDMQGGYRQPLVEEPKVIVGSTQAHATINYDGICPTLPSAMGMGGGHVPMHNYMPRIRKLTPRECWRLMGFTDEEFDKASVGTSNTQLYKMARKLYSR